MLILVHSKHVYVSIFSCSTQLIKVFCNTFFSNLHKSHLFTKLLTIAGHVFYVPLHRYKWNANYRYLYTILLSLRQSFIISFSHDMNRRYIIYIAPSRPVQILTTISTRACYVKQMNLHEYWHKKNEFYVHLFLKNGSHTVRNFV